MESDFIHLSDHPTQPPSPIRNGQRLNIPGEDLIEEGKHDYIISELESDIELTIDVSENKESNSIIVKRGQTIEYVKSQIETLYGLKMDTLSLSANGTLLFDPMTISDYPSLLQDRRITVVCNKK